MPASGAAEIDIKGFRAFEQAGWESAGKAVQYESAWGPITIRTVGPLLEAARVRPGGQVLDVATGPGYVAAAAGRRGAVVVGVDIATSMVSLARRLHSGIEFRHSRAERLPSQTGPSTPYSAISSSTISPSRKKLSPRPTAYSSQEVGRRSHSGTRQAGTASWASCWTPSRPSARNRQATCPRTADLPVCR